MISMCTKFKFPSLSIPGWVRAPGQFIICRLVFSHTTNLCSKFELTSIIHSKYSNEVPKFTTSKWLGVTEGHWQLYYTTDNSCYVPALIMCHFKDTALIKLKFHVPLNRSFRRHSPSQSHGLVWKTEPNTTKAHIHQSKQMYYNTK